MTTAEEIKAKYKAKISSQGSAPVSEDDIKAKYRQRMDGIGGEVKAATPTEAPPTPAEGGTGLLERSRQALALGASDAAHSLMGNTYGRYGDGTDPDYLDPAGRVQKALGGDIIPAVGGVIADTAMTAGRQILPKAVKDKIGAATEYVTSSAPAEALSEGLSRWRQASPDTYARAGEVSNMMLPRAGYKPKPKFGANARTKLNSQNAAIRRQEVGNLIEPDAGKGHGDFEIQPGLLERKKYQPSPAENRRLDTVADVESVNPRKSYTENKSAINEEVYKIDSELKTKLADVPDVPEISVDHALKKAIEKSGLSPTMVGDAGKAAERMYAYLDDIIQESAIDGLIPAAKLLDIRRKLDDWLEANGVKWAAGTDAGKGLDIAKREVRTTLNTLVDSADTAAGTAGDLKRMSELLSARDIITPRMYAEAGTRPGRYLQNLERATGIRHPTTPMALASGATDVKTGLLSGSLALGAGAGSNLHKISRTGDAIVMETLAEAIRKGVPSAQIAAIAAGLNPTEDGEQ